MLGAGGAGALAKPLPGGLSHCMRKQTIATRGCHGCKVHVHPLARAYRAQETNTPESALGTPTVADCKNGHELSQSVRRPRLFLHPLDVGWGRGCMTRILTGPWLLAHCARAMLSDADWHTCEQSIIIDSV